MHIEVDGQESCQTNSIAATRKPIFDRHACTVIGHNVYFRGLEIESTLAQEESVRVEKSTNKNEEKIGHPKEVADNKMTQKRELIGKTKQEEGTQDTETKIPQELEKDCGIENKEESGKIREKDK